MNLKTIAWDVLGAGTLTSVGLVWLALLQTQVCVPGCEVGSDCVSDCGVNSPWFAVAGLLAVGGAALAAWRLYAHMR
jgi:hypothetical protein